LETTDENLESCFGYPLGYTALLPWGEGSLIGKLPLEFKKLGFDTHSKFDQLAMDTQDLGDGNHALTGLATLLQNCVACHAAHQIEATDD
jgi:hypothetical protein